MASALLFNEKDALPEEIDEATAVAESLHGLFIGRNPTAAGTEDLEELVIKSLSFAALVVGVFPFLSEFSGTGADLGPA